MNAVIKIEAARTRLSFVIVVVSVAFSAACFLERLLRDYASTDAQPNVEASNGTESLPKWLKRNKVHPRPNDREKAEWRAPPIQEGLWCWLPS